ncbi:probable L-type lectin-domain containing receptor kinase VII.2, partial [Arachis duranensis]|uniref:Probable L-type lectin-domain containing receptor kinase VII.2 n=1 Tax=Arachis duranensis TaxID=130453 RepID=A0A6P4D2B4_ARADU
ATIDDHSHSHSHSSILTLTNHASFSIGRAFYPSKIPTKSSFSSNPLPFSTSFIFSVAPFKHLLPGHGFVFLFSPFEGANGVSSAQHLGLFNLTNNGNPKNYVFGIEFDVFKNQEFNDINDNHVGLDVNSLTSLASHDAGFWVSGKHDEKFKELKLNNGENYQVWIEYSDSRVNVAMAIAGKRRPNRPLISELVNLSDVFLDEMFVGFCGATEQLIESHKILAWSFSNSNFSIGDGLVTTNLPSFGFVSGISFGILIFVIGSAAMVFVVLLKRKRSKRMEEEGDIEDWELEYWPHRISYEDIYAATKAFSEQNIIEFGGMLKDVAMGVLYLHESWKVKVLHRDIKASNVLLEKDMNARLGDFGLARMHHHEQIPNTSRVIGTVGYMAPELLRTGRASSSGHGFHLAFS